MTPDARVLLRKHLIEDEGLRLKPYRDTVGKLTIGIGRNLADKGISRNEAFYLFENDLDEHWTELIQRFPWVLDLDPVRQVALANLAFNMGVSGLATFVNTLAAIKRADWTAAANGLKRSKWHRQVQRSRRERIVAMILTGKVPNA